MAREFASPELANLIAARLPPDEFDRRAQAPLTGAEAQEVAELLDWFTRRYPTAAERLAYARRKMRDYARGQGAAVAPATYRETARRLARAHRDADPQTVAILLAPDPAEREIRLVEVTPAAPTLNDPMAVEFVPRPDLSVPFACTVVILSPAEWEAVAEGRIELPYPFRVGLLERL